MKKKTLLISLFGLSFVFSSALAGDAKNGKKVFKKCAACHNVASGAKHKTGPKLWNIVGARAGVHAGHPARPACDVFRDSWRDCVFNGAAGYRDPPLAAH